MKEMFNWVLLFVAVALFLLMMLRLLNRYLHEKLELSSRESYERLKRFIPPKKLLSMRIFGALLTAAAMFVGQLGCGVEKLQIAFPVSFGFAVAAYFLIYRWYYAKLIARNLAFESKVLELTMGLANGLKSGLALGQALDAVAKRIAEPMREELQMVLSETRLGVDFPEAFSRLYRRMPCEDLHLLVTTIIQTTKSGGSLTDVLDEMVITIRGRNEFQERLKNMTAAGKFEALAISCAPLAAFAILYFMDPMLMKPLVTTGIGWCAVAVAATLVGIGYAVLKKMITIEV